MPRQVSTVRVAVSAGARSTAASTLGVAAGVGLALAGAAVVARSGCRVRGVDVTQSVVDTINRGEIHIEEADLDGLVQGVVQRGMLRASTAIAPAEVAQNLGGIIGLASVQVVVTSRIMAEGGYRLERLEVIDQFRWSPHVEIAAAFRRQA